MALRGLTCRILLQLLEVPGYRQVAVAGFLVRAACRGMSGIPSRLDHCYCHPGVLDPRECELGQGGTDADALVVWVNGQHVDFTHAALGMKLYRHEPDGARSYLSDPHSRLVRSENGLHRPPLALSPAFRVELLVDFGLHRALDGRENRRPRPQREADHRVGVLVFERSNPWVDGPHLPTITETKFTHPTR